MVCICPMYAVAMTPQQLQDHHEGFSEEDIAEVQV